MKRANLGVAADVHAKVAAGETEELRAKLEIARSSLAKGRCRAALRDLTDAVFVEGNAHTNFIAAWGAKTYDRQAEKSFFKVRAQRRRVQAEFARECLR